MNRERLLKVADAIERGAIHEDKLGFNMASFKNLKAKPEEDMTGKSCGTTMCICGWVNALFAPETYAGDTSRGAELLDLEGEQEWDLFFNREAVNTHQITAGHAVAVLRHAADTGEIDWGKFVHLSPGVVRTEDYHGETDDE